MTSWKRSQKIFLRVLDIENKISFGYKYWLYASYHRKLFRRKLEKVLLKNTKFDILFEQLLIVFYSSYLWIYINYIWPSPLSCLILALISQMKMYSPHLGASKTNPIRQPLDSSSFLLLKLNQFNYQLSSQDQYTNI